MTFDDALIAGAFGTLFVAWLTGYGFGVVVRLIRTAASSWLH